MESAGKWHREFSKMNYVLDGRAKTDTELIIRKRGRRNLSRRGQRENSRRDDIRDSSACRCRNVLTVTCHRLAHLIQRAHLHIHKHLFCHGSCTSSCSTAQFCAVLLFWAAQWVAFSNEVKCDARLPITKCHHCASVPRLLLFCQRPTPLLWLWRYSNSAENNILPQIVHGTTLSRDDLISFPVFSFSNSGGPCGLPPRSSGIAPMPIKLTWYRAARELGWTATSAGW